MRYTITAALPYTNGPLHIGHLAGVYIPADIFVRYLRQKKQDVIYICGSDEHGVAISIKAMKEGASPEAIINKYHKIIKTAFEDFGIAFDHYGRTSSQTHYQTASEFFMNLHGKGLFEVIETEQLYDPEAKKFLADRFVVGECPKCGNPEAYGDQCERCGSSLNATDLINPKSTISGAQPILKPTKHWFLPLNDYTDFLTKWILDGHKNDWKPNVYGQVKSWLDDGLKPRAVTRDLDWGIPVPLPDAEGKVLYVWFDAPIGYISATQEWAARKGVDWKPYWTAPDTKLIHFIGKDNIVFHCVIFPAMLKAHGGYILPENVPANEFLNLEGNKLSTSKNWAVWLHEYLQDFPGKQDVLRYTLASLMPEAKDSDFTWKDFQNKNNSELVAIFGNFFNRVTTLTLKHYGGVAPSAENMEKPDMEAIDILAAYPKRIGTLLDKFRFREAQQELMNLARHGNKYLADQEPWKLFAQQPQKAEAIMYTALQITAALSLLSVPFLPFTSEKMISILNLSKDIDPYEADLKTLLPPGHLIGQPTLLFDKIEDESILRQVEKLQKHSTAPSAPPTPEEIAPFKEIIDFQAFESVDIRVGTIVSAEKMPKADKLLILKINDGRSERTIVSGIAEHHKPEDIIGKKVCFVANLAPRKLKGVESCGMILTAETADRKLAFISPENPETPNGKPVL